MTATNAATAFHALVALYEDHGWDVRTIDRAGLRATVRASAAYDSTSEAGPAPTRLTACRKLWVDAGGQVLETDVPC